MSSGNHREAPQERWFPIAVNLGARERLRLNKNMLCSKVSFSVLVLLNLCSKAIILHSNIFCSVLLSKPAHSVHFQLLSWTTFSSTGEERKQPLGYLLLFCSTVANQEHISVIEMNSCHVCFKISFGVDEFVFVFPLNYLRWLGFSGLPGLMITAAAALYIL